MPFRGTKCDGKKLNLSLMRLLAVSFGKGKSEGKKENKVKKAKEKIPMPKDKIRRCQLAGRLLTTARLHKLPQAGGFASLLNHPSQPEYIVCQLYKLL